MTDFSKATPRPITTPITDDAIEVLKGTGWYLDWISRIEADREALAAKDALIAELVEAVADKACDCTPENQCQPTDTWICKHRVARDLIAKAREVKG